MEFIIKNKLSLVIIISWVVYVVTRLVLYIYSNSDSEVDITSGPSILVIVTFVLIVLTFIGLLACVVTLLASIIIYIKGGTRDIFLLNASLSFLYVFVSGQFIVSILRIFYYAT